MPSGKMPIAQLAKHRPNRIPWTFEHLPNDETIIHITQKNGRRHQFKVWTKYFLGILNHPEMFSFCVSPQNAKKPDGPFYCKINYAGTSMYLHRFIRQYDITAEKPQIHHHQGTTDNTPDNLSAVSAKENLAARKMPPKK